MEKPLDWVVFWGRDGDKISNDFAKDGFLFSAMGENEDPLTPRVDQVLSSPCSCLNTSKKANLNYRTIIQCKGLIWQMIKLRPKVIARGPANQPSLQTASACRATESSQELAGKGSEPEKEGTSTSTGICVQPLPHQFLLLHVSVLDPDLDPSVSEPQG